MMNIWVHHHQKTGTWKEERLINMLFSEIQVQVFERENKKKKLDTKFFVILPLRLV